MYDLYDLAHVAAWKPHDLQGVLSHTLPGFEHLVPGSCTDLLAQHVIDKGQDLDYLDGVSVDSLSADDLSDLPEVWKLSCWMIGVRCGEDGRED